MRDMTLLELVARSAPTAGQLSSAIRLFVLDYFRNRAIPPAPAAAQDAPRVQA